MHEALVGPRSAGPLFSAALTMPFCAAAVFLAVAAFLTPRAAADDYAALGWERVFTDEFDGDAINTDAWNVLYRPNSFNNEKQFYLPEQVSVAEGRARITATNERFQNKAYRSGLIRTHTEWSYGRFEVRADLPTSQGMWPAIWLLPRTVNWPTGGEIDIMENRGSQPTLVSSAYHWQNNPNTPCCDERQYVLEEHTATGSDGQPVNYHAGYHTYAAEWEPGVVRFYVDGVRHWTMNEDANLTIFDTAKSLIINLAVGGIFGGDPNAATVWPQHFDIDYVRIWQRENGFTGLVNGGFDEDGGSLSDWRTWNDSGSNLSVSTANTAGGDAALRLAAAGTGTEAGAFQSVAINGGERLRARASSFVPAGGTFTGGSDVSLKVEFYRQSGADYGGSDFLGEELFTLADTGHALNTWLDHTYLVDAPANAVEARYTLIVDGSGGNQGVGYFDAASLVAVPDLDGDYNFDGVVDAADYTVWRDNQGATTNLAADANGDRQVNAADYQAWAAAFTGASVVTVPEPAGLAAVAAAVALIGRRRVRVETLADRLQ